MQRRAKLHAAALAIQRGWKVWRAYRQVVENHKQTLLLQAHQLGHATRESQKHLRRVVSSLQARVRALLHLRRLDKQVQAVRDFSLPLLLLFSSLFLSATPTCSGANPCWPFPEREPSIHNMLGGWGVFGGQDQSLQCPFFPFVLGGGPLLVCREKSHKLQLLLCLCGVHSNNLVENCPRYIFFLFLSSDLAAFFLLPSRFPSISLI